MKAKVNKYYTLEDCKNHYSNTFLYGELCGILEIKIPNNEHFVAFYGDGKLSYPDFEEVVCGSLSYHTYGGTKVLENFSVKTAFDFLLTISINANSWKKQQDNK